MRLPNFALVNWRIVGAAVGIILVGILIFGGITWAIVDSTHPDKKVREGRVIERRFIPAHEHHWIQTIATPHTSCSYNSSTKSQSCSTSYTYIYIPQTDHIPDAWWVKVEGCKRLKADDPLETCEKPSVRKVWVGEITYEALQIGRQWRESGVP